MEYLEESLESWLGEELQVPCLPAWLQGRPARQRQPAGSSSAQLWSAAAAPLLHAVSMTVMTC